LALPDLHPGLKTEQAMVNNAAVAPALQFQGSSAQRIFTTNQLALIGQTHKQVKWRHKILEPA
jgi:hypothetical protein